MSCISSKKSPTSSTGSGVAQNRSISEIVRSLKSSFLDSDFEAAVVELKSRENGLRREKMEKCDVLEGELGKLKVERFDWWEERRRLMRERQVSDDKLNELARELSSMREKEGNAVKRYSSLHNEVRQMEEEKKKLITMYSNSNDEVEELKRELREKEYALEEYAGRDAQYDARMEELEEVKRKNKCLEEEKLKYDAYVEEMKRGKDESLKELLNKNGAEKSQLEDQLKALGQKFKEAVEKNEFLESQKVELGAQFEELRRNIGEKIKKLSEDRLNLERVNAETVKEKDAEIQEILKDKESLEMEKRKLTEKLEQVEEKLSKLEKDVIACLTMDLERSKRFGSTHVEKIISGIIKVIDSEENGLICAGADKDRNTQKSDSAIVSHVNEPKCPSKLDKQSLEAVKKALDFKEEFKSKDGSAVDDKVVINLDDSDDDNENALPASDASNKRKHPGSNGEQHHEDNSNDNNLNPKHKMTKSEPAPCKQVKQESSLATFSEAKHDHYYNAFQKGTLSSIRRCVADLEKEVSGSGCFSEDNGKKDDGSKYTNGTRKFLSPKAEELMSSLQKKKEIKEIVCRADMFIFLAKDDDLCAKGVCALYRQQMALSSGMGGSYLAGSRGIEECDIKRVATLAEFLIDGDPRRKMKKSLAELERHDSHGLNDCRLLATKYSDKLTEIYLKRKDPLFCPLSSELQYK